MRTDWGQFIWPPQVQPGPEVLEGLSTIIEALTFGDPLLFPHPRPFTISLTRGQAIPQAFPSQRLVAIPLAVAESAPIRDLRRTVHHELAHLVLVDFLDGRDVPRWFSEGFAEWSVGRSCEAELRLRLDVTARLRVGMDLPDILSQESGAAPDMGLRLAYDYALTVFEFIGRGLDGPDIADFLRTVRAQGIPGALRARGIGDLKNEWHTYLAGQYSSLALSESCQH